MKSKKDIHKYMMRWANVSFLSFRQRIRITRRRAKRYRHFVRILDGFKISISPYVANGSMQINPDYHSDECICDVCVKIRDHKELYSRVNETEFFITYPKNRLMEDNAGGQCFILGLGNYRLPSTFGMGRYKS